MAVTTVGDPSSGRYGQALRDLAIRWKLAVLIVAVSGASFLLASGALLINARADFKSDIVQDLSALAEAVGGNSAAALRSGDADAARRTLQALRSHDTVLGGALYDASGRWVARYTRHGEIELPTAAPDDGHGFARGRVWLSTAVDPRDPTAGRIYLLGSTHNWNQALIRFLSVIGLLFLAVLGLSLLLSLKLQRLITGPIGELLDVSRQVADKRDYRRRAIKNGNDEIGELVDGFNDMLQQIESRRAEVERTQQELQQRIEQLAAEVAERQRTETELRRSREALRDFIESASIGLHWLDADGRIVWVNRFELELLGYGKDEFLGRPIAEFHADAAAADDMLARLARHEPLDNFEACLRCKDGSLRFVLLSSNVYWDNGRFVHTRCFLRDITARKRAEEALRASEERYRTLIAASTSVVTIGDEDGKLVEPQPSWEAYTGQRWPQYADSGWTQALHPDDRDPFLAGHGRAIGAGDAFKGEARVWHSPSGRYRYCLVRAVPLRRDDGTLREWIGTITDVDDRRRAEEQFRLAVESAPNGMLVVTDRGRIVLVNRQLEQMFGYTREELIGQPVEVLLPSTIRNAHPQLLESFFRDPKTRPMGATRNLFGRRKDGRPVPIEIGLNPFVTQDGTFCLASIIDITARKRAEQDLKHHTEELERSNRELGQFAYVASHDLQEPLRAVSGCVQLLKQRYDGKLDTRANDLIEHAVAGASRMQGLINDLLVYSRVGTRGKPFEDCDCTEPLSEALANLEFAVRETDAVITHDPLPVVHGDRTQLTQLFQNLIGNALKFRGDQRPQVHVGAERKGNGYLLSVRDNGIGIEPQHFERVFGVFQRLHSRREYPGNGIGLAICRKIVERHHGRMWVDATPGKGATFYFTLPHGEANETAERQQQRQ